MDPVASQQVIAISRGRFRYELHYIPKTARKRNFRPHTITEVSQLGIEIEQKVWFCFLILKVRLPRYLKGEKV